MSQYDLIDRPEEIPELVMLIAELAKDHHRRGDRYMPGRAILDWFDVKHREKGRQHIRLATAVYRNTRWSLELRDSGLGEIHR